MTYQITIDYEWDFILERVIQKEIARKWEETCFMANRITNNDHYWAKEIDQLADILIQIRNQQY